MTEPEKTAFFAYLAGRQGVTESRGPPLDRRVEPAFDLIVRIWKQNSRMIAAICAARSIPYLHVLQATLHDAGSKTLTATEVEHSGTPPTWIEGVQIGYPLLRRAAERLRRDAVPFLDASRLFFDVREELYVDGCHFVERGHHLLADAIADALLGMHESAR